MNDFPNLAATFEDLSRFPIGHFLSEGDILVERETMFLKEILSGALKAEMIISDPDDIDILLGSIVTDTISREIPGLIYRWMVLNTKAFGTFYFAEINFCEWLSKAKFGQRSTQDNGSIDTITFTTDELLEILDWCFAQYSEFRKHLSGGDLISWTLEEKDRTASYLKAIAAISAQLTKRLKTP